MTEAQKRPVAFAIILLAVCLLPFLGNGGILAAAILGLALVGAPLFVIIGAATVMCFLLWTEVAGLSSFSTLIERTRGLADSPNLLAIPLFIMSGAVMSRGQISLRLVDFAKSLIGWIPGGLAISTVVACMLFAAISGSSPATVIAIGAMMGPTLIKNRYSERFSHGLLTSAGSLGILIPPSIPMIIYPIVYQRGGVEVEQLFASGFGPGLLMGGLLMAYSVYRGVVDKAPTVKFDVRELVTSLRDGFWALMFPVLILGGIYSGAFYALEAAAVSVVYAVVVEVWVHRAIKLKQLPGIFHETGIFLGALLVIMISALVLTEFLEGQDIPQMAVDWVRSLDIGRWEFLIILNLLLLVVGAMMDILSAMFIFVPLLAPIAAADPFNVDPMHFGIIFIVNLELGYLTPPVGLNLFVASTLFNKPIGHVVRSVLPFIAIMLIGVAIVTYVPAVSVGLGRWIMGVEPPAERPHTTQPAELGDGDPSQGDEGEMSFADLVAEIERLRAEGGTMADMRREGELVGRLQERLREAQSEMERLGQEGGTMADMRRESELQGILDEYGSWLEDDGAEGGGLDEPTEDEPTEDEAP